MMKNDKDEILKESLNYGWFYERAIELKIAANEIYKLFMSIALPDSLNEREKVNGLGFSYMLIMAVAIENLIKSRIIKQVECSDNKFRHIGEVIELWQNKKMAHDVIKLASKYNISLFTDEIEFIERYKPFMIWAGRFPFPNKEEGILDYFSSNSHFVLKENDPELIERFFNRICLEIDKIVIE